MVQEIELPDGEIVEFPDDTSDEQIQQALSAELGVRRAEGVSDQPQDAPTPLDGSAGVGQPSNQFERPAGGPTPLERLGGAAMLGAEVAATFIPALAAVKAVNVIAKVAPRVGKVLQKATVFSKGDGFKGVSGNILRAAAGGAAGGASTEALLGRDPVKGAAAGAVGGPLGLGLGVSLKAARTFMDDPAAKGLRVIAKKLKVTPEEVGKRFLDFKAVMGRNPSIIEVADDQAVAEIRDIISRTAGATAIARGRVKDISKTRAGEFAGVVSGGKVTTTAAAQKARQKARGDIQFGELREQNIELTDDASALLNDRVLRANVTPETKFEIDAVIEASGDGPVQITGELADFIRQDLNQKAATGVGSKQRILNIKRDFEDAVGASSPEFTQALDEFAARGARAEGVAAGRKLIGQETSEALAVAESATTADFAAGLRVGTRSGLEDAAQESLSRAGRLAQDLSRDEGLVGRLSAVLPASEIAALQKAGVIEAKALQNIGNVAPSIQAEGGKVVDNAIKAAVGAMAVGATNVGGAFKVGVFNNLTALLPPFMSKKARESLARDILDPTKTKAVLSALKNLKLRDKEILDLFATSFTAGSQAAQAGN